MKKSFLINSLTYFAVLTVFISEKGYSQVWSSIGSGVNSNVYAFAVDSASNELYVGGWFLEAGGIPAPHIAKWDGTTWSSVGGGMNNTFILTDVRSICFFNGDLYAAGAFDSAGGIQVKNIAKWNGLNWAPVGAGLNKPVHVLQVYNGELYAGGAFDSSGTIAVNMIAKWDGSNWTNVGSGTDNDVLTMCNFNNNLYVGGYFTQAGGIPAYRVAKWDGINWNTVGSGFGNTVRKLYVFNNELFAGGDFTSISVNPSQYISKFNGTSWQALPFPNEKIKDFATYNGNLYVTGAFTFPSYIARFDGNTYFPLGPGLSWTGDCLTIYKNEMYVGGSFSSVGGGLPNTVGIAKWNDAVGIFENIVSVHALTYPSPFREQVCFSLPKFINTLFPFRLSIYNLLGERCILIENINSLTYQLQNINLPTGIYYYRFQNKTGSSIATGQITSE